MRPAALALAACLLVACGERERPGVPPQHVILVTVEGLRADHISALGYDRPTTAAIPGARPDQALALDQLAERGVVFTNAFAFEGPPEEARQAFATRAIEGQDPDLWLDPSEAFPGVEAVLFRTAPDAQAEGKTRGAVHSYPSDAATIFAAISWFKSQDWSSDARRLMWVHLSGPTFPWQPESIDLPTSGARVDFERLFADPTVDTEADGSPMYRIRQDRPGPDEAARVVAAYDGEVARWNLLLWVLLDSYRFETRAVNAWPRTATVVAGVQGQTLPGEGEDWGRFDAPTDGVLGVPLVLHHPQSLTGSRMFSTPVTTRDVLPTIAAWFGVDPDPAWTGRSLFDHVDHRPLGPFEERVAWTRLTDGTLTVRDERWRLVVSPGGEARLFDIAREPHGHRDRSAEHPEEVARLLALVPSS